MTIPHALLALLAEEPKFGLRLKEEFEARTGSIWPLNVGQVYTTLQRLERDGFVANSAEEGTSPSQKLYKLTETGRSELTTWLSTPPVEANPPRDEVVIKVMVALSVPGVDVLDIVQDHRRQAIEAMQSLTRLKPGHQAKNKGEDQHKNENQDLALVLVVDAQLFRLEATVRWLDSCEARLSRGGRLEIPAPNPAPTSTSTSTSTSPSSGVAKSP